MLLGVISVLASGIFTIFFGVVFEYIGSKYDFKNTMLFYTILTIVCCAIMSLVVPGSLANMALLPVLFSTIGGAINITGLISMQKAMRIGNAGIAWALCQAGLLGPFLFCIIYYHERPTILQYVGALIMLIGMGMLSVNEKSEDRGEKTGNNLLYLICAFGSFFCTCVNGALVVCVSKVAPEFAICLRLLFMYIGTGIVLSLLLLLSKSLNMRISKGMFLSSLALMICGLGCSGLTFIGSNALAEVNLASIAIPIMQGTAIGGFALYSTFVLKEKCSILKWCGIVAIILGIVFLV